MVLRNELQIKPKKLEATTNPSKLSASKTDPIITYNDSPINCMETSKYLGVKLDFKLNYKPQITLVENKIAKSVGKLSKLRYLFPSSTLFLLHYSFINHHLLFGLFYGETRTQLILPSFNAFEKKSFV